MTLLHLHQVKTTLRQCPNTDLLLCLCTLQVTLLHLHQVKTTLRQCPNTELSLRLIERVEQQLLKTYKGMSMGRQHLLRQTLQRFFQERRVKVSLFLGVSVVGEF